jgi:hypothetical protein
LQDIKTPTWEREMEESSNTARVSVLPNQAEKKARIELEGTLRCLSMLSWELSTKQVLALCDLPVSEALLVDEIVPALGSTANRLGHLTLESLVTSAPDKFGLGLEWRTFYDQIRALVYQQKFHIADSDVQEIVALVDDVTSVLNRTPVDAGEFHGVKQRLLEQKMVEQGDAHATRINEMAERQKSLVMELARSRDHIADLQIRQAQLMEEGASKIKAMTRDLAISLEAHELKAEARLNEATESLELAHQEAIEALTQQLNTEIEQHRSAAKDAEREHSMLLARIDSGDFVEASKLQDMESKLSGALAEARRLEHNAAELNGQLTQAKLALEASQEEISQLKDQSLDAQAQIESLEARVREQIEQGINSPEFAVLQERLSLRKQENEKLTERLEQAHQAHSKMKSKARTFAKRFSKAKVEIQLLEDRMRETVESHQIALNRP